MFREYIIKNTDKNARILEFGPLNRPIFKKANLKMLNMLILNQLMISKKCMVEMNI